MVDTAMIQLVLLALASSTAEELDDRALSRRIKQGDHQAFQSFFDGHYDSLLRFLLSKNIDSQTAQDLIQKAFLYIWEHRYNIDPEKSLRSYLFRIAYTRMLNHHRDNKKFNTEQAVPARKTDLTPEDSARASDLQNAIERALQKMPDKRGTVFQLCFMQDLTYREAAKILEVSVKTIENHMGLAFKDMRQALQKFR